jgi:hypothetical protein
VRAGGIQALEAAMQKHQDDEEIEGFVFDALRVFEQEADNSSVVNSV